MSTSFIKEKLPKTEAFKRVSAGISSNQNTFIKRSIGTLNSFLLDYLSSTKKQLLVISDTDESARFLYSDLQIISETQPVLFPSSNRKPYDNRQLTDSALMVQRAEALQLIAEGNPPLVITSIQAITEKIAPPSVFDEVSLTLKKGDEIGLEKLTAELVEQGYKSVKFVDAPGEFAVRGGIFDVFPFSGEYPLRLEFFGDELDTIREFDADSQRSIAFLNQARIIPDITNLPESQKESFLSYFDENTLIISSHPEYVKGEIDSSYEKAVRAYEELDDNEALLPEELFLSKEAFLNE